MKILAFNASPRKNNGATDIVLNKFLEGAKDAGGEIEKIYLADTKIIKCKGCFSCWIKTPGKCVFQNDDMPEILRKMEEADIVVYATPLYHFNMASDMKIMIEKTLPISEPYLIRDKEITTHPRRNKVKQDKWVIVSVCGFPEIEHFQALDLCFEQNARAHKAKIVGKIYRPGSEALKTGAPLFKKYLANCYLAGKEVVGSGEISETVQQELYKDFVMPKFLFRFMANRFWKKHMNSK
ncbi:MAG: flavodoxin family protein [bacterium]